MAKSSAENENLTVKQQREARRQQKVAQLKKQQAKERRNRVVAIVTGSVAAVAVVAVVIGIVVSNATRVQYDATLAADERAEITIAGEETYPNLTNMHIDGGEGLTEYPDGTVDYAEKWGMEVPAGGDHLSAWLNCGVYSEPQTPENAVHALEHGAVWIMYNPDEVEAATVEDLYGRQVPSSKIIISPVDDLQSPMAVSAWGADVLLDGPEDPRLEEFIKKYWQSGLVPEPGASCSGAVEGPGRVA